VARLDAPLDGIEPLPLGADPADDGWIGQDVTVVGWGSVDLDGNGWGTRRATGAVVSDLLPDTVVLDTSAEGTALCPGDSGSPVFRAQADGVLAIDAVESWGQVGDPSACGPVAGAQRLDVARDWVVETLAGFEPEPATTEPADPPDAAPASSEEAACGCRSTQGGLALLPGVVAIGRRRRRAPALRRQISQTASS
jgi:hypothetical protein